MSPKTVTGSLPAAILLAGTLAFHAFAQPPPARPHASNARSGIPAAQPKPATTPKPAKPAKSAKPDFEIHACIQDKLAAVPKVTDAGFISASVVNGVVTFTGTLGRGGGAGNVAAIAKGCGAKQVVNQIATQAATSVPKKK